MLKMLSIFGSQDCAPLKLGVNGKKEVEDALQQFGIRADDFFENTKRFPAILAKLSEPTRKKILEYFQ